jgi:hypothetical protein
MYTATGELQPVFLGAGFANCYTLNPALLTDDDYGQIAPYYMTYGFVNHDQEQAFQLGSGLKVNQWNQAFCSGVGTLAFTPYLDSPSNPMLMYNGQPWTISRGLTSAPKFDIPLPGIARAERVFFRFASLPLAGTTDNTFNIQKFAAWFKVSKRAPVRGAAQ